MKTFGHCQCGQVAHYQYESWLLCIPCAVDIVRAFGSIETWLARQQSAVIGQYGKKR